MRTFTSLNEVPAVNGHDNTRIYAVNKESLPEPAAEIVRTHVANVLVDGLVGYLVSCALHNGAGTVFRQMQ